MWRISPIPVICLVIVLVLTSTMLAQSKDFSGKWIVDVEKTTVANANSPAPANDITVTMNEKTMAVVTATQLLGPVTNVYNLDGSESRNEGPVGILRNGKTPPAAVSTVTWEGGVLVVTTPTEGVMTETSKYSMDGANLKVEFLLAVYRRNTGNVNPQLTVTSDRTIIYRRAEEFGARAYNPGVGIENPSLIKKVEPEYTDDAKRAKIQGEVELEVVVLPNGSVGDIRVIRSLDRTYGLDEKAIEAARQWAFKPGKRDGRPLPVIVRLILSFRLH